MPTITIAFYDTKLTGFGVKLVHGEARGREPLAELIRKKHGITPLLPEQDDAIKR